MPMVWGVVNRRLPRTLERAVLMCEQTDHLWVWHIL